MGASTTSAVPEATGVPLAPGTDWQVVAGVLLVLFSLAAIAGGMALFLLCFRSEWSGRLVDRIGDHAVKLWAEVVQWGVGLTAIIGGFAIGDAKAVWYWPAVSGSVCLVIWKFVQMSVDRHVKAASELARKAADESVREADLKVRRAEQTVRIAGEVCGGIRGALGQRLNRIVQVSNGVRNSLELRHVREALISPSLMDDLLVRLATALKLLHDTAGEPANIRVGVFVQLDERMVAEHGIDLRNPYHNPFRSHDKYKDWYALRKPKKRTGEPEKSSVVVRCIHEQRTIVIEDCEAAFREGNFGFTHEDRKNYLRSMVAYPLGEVVDRSGRRTLGVIAADSDRGKHFLESSLELDMILREFGLRIRLEMALFAFLSPPETDP